MNFELTERDLKTYVECETRVRIPLDSTSIIMGSCFSQHLSNFFTVYGFQHLSLPYGVQYNPITIFKLLRRTLDEIAFEEDEVFINPQNLFAHFDVHSSFNHRDKVIFLDKLNSSRKQFFDYLSEAHLLIITFGTSYVYMHPSHQFVVGNCHFMNNTQFAYGKWEQRMLCVEEIIDAAQSCFQVMIERFPQLKIICTISPVRHTRIGVHLNNISKSTLLLAIHQLCNQYSYCSYIPTYELMMDELRDYRFYTPDLVHPNQLAIDYIFSRLAPTLFSAPTLKIMKQVKKLRSLELHNVKNPDKEIVDAHKEKVKNLRSTILKQYPFLKL